MKAIRFFSFFIVLVFLYIYLHYYVSLFFSRYGIFSKNTWFRIFLVFALISVLFLFLRRKLTSGLFEYFYIFGFSWMGYILILGLLIFISDILLKLFVFDFRKIFFITISLSILIFLKSVYNAIIIPETKSINLVMENITNPYKIVFISDMHLDFSFKNKIFSKIIEKISKQKPDILIIGGDLIDPGFSIDSDILKIRALNFPVIGVYGNHEYYYGFDKTKDVYRKLGIEILRNQKYAFGDINFIGSGDIQSEDIDYDDFDKIISSLYDKDKLNILISHQPLYFDRISEKYNLIMLSGHTHCGQIFPFHIFTRIFYKYFYGEYKNKSSYLYVSCGVGTWGPPIRFLSKSDIIVLNINPK